MKNKSKKLKIKKELTAEENEFRNFILIIVGIIVLVAIVYGVSEYFQNKNEEALANEVEPGEVNYDLITVGTLFSKPEKDYYVIVYDREDSQSIYYSALVSKYADKTDSLNVYFCDLSNKFNKDYIAKDESNPKAKELKDLAFGKLTLLKISNGKITKYLESTDDVKKEFGI